MAMYRRLQRLGRVRWSSNAKPTSNIASRHSVGASTRSATPGTVRVTKGYGADKHEAELDSTLARIIGSDWGDRSHQPVSMPMRIYWIVFGVVLINGLFTYFAGKDESFLVEKLKKKADEKLGVEEEENEFEEMVEKQHTSNNTVELVGEKRTAAPTSMLNSSVVPSGMPFLAPGMSPQPTTRRPKSKMELEQQLAQLRMQQERLQKQIRSGEGVAEEELEHQIRMIDIQKEQVKHMIKSL